MYKRVDINNTYKITPKITSELSGKSVSKSVQPPLKLRSIRGKKGGGEKECFSSPNFCVFLVVGILTPGKKNLATKDQKVRLAPIYAKISKDFGHLNFIFCKIGMSLDLLIIRIINMPLHE